jgi:hypothetical protein
MHTEMLIAFRRNQQADLYKLSVRRESDMRESTLHPSLLQ